MDAFDIDSIALSHTADLAIIHPATGEPTSWVWTLAGPGHPQSVAVMNDAAREAQRLNRLREQAVANRKRWHEPDRDVEDIRRDNALSFARRVVGWTPARINGADYPFSVENAVALLMNPDYNRVYLQLLEFFTSEDAFTVRSEKT